MEPATETLPAPPASDATEGPGRAARPRWREPWTLGLAGVLLVALLLRLWGIRYGLPLAYNIDERSHFVPRAVGLFTKGTLDPHYQLNPDGFIYLVGAALGIVYHGRHAVTHAYLTNPGDVYLVGRVVSALLGTVAVWLVYAAGRKVVARGTALLAAGLLAVAFLAVHYGHLALNDSPALAFIALALLGAAGIYEDGGRRWYLVAGLGVGLAAAVKYNAGIMLLPLIAAAVVRAFAGERRPALTGLGLAVLGILAGFAILDPYAFLDWSYFRHELNHLSVYENGSLLLGETQRSGFRYYAWSLTWGFGWVPLILCFVGGAVLLVRRALWPLAAVLIPAPIVFFLFNGAQGRYFARYMLPIFPLLCLIAAVGAAFLVRLAA
ncbi:MAG: glycosyltransferase family 39 protein, partial [Solirubrobacterales bacterium]|nr:glycosyltransferase family 39 protein [Solirubrobacterales bacterium]